MPAEKSHRFKGRHDAKKEQYADMIEKLKSYDKYRIDGLTAGIKHDTRENLLSNADKPFPEFFYSRHSMRQFDGRTINVEDIKKAIKIAQKAPTACNRQASKVYMYTDKETNVALGELIAGNTGFQQEVQNYLVVTADVSAFYDTFERNQVYVEAGLFSMALVEALHYYGIGSCILQNRSKVHGIYRPSFRAFQYCGGSGRHAPIR